MTIGQIRDLCFKDMQDLCAAKTEGVGKYRGVTFLTLTLDAIDTNGKECSFRVKLSSTGKRAIENLGRTQGQIEKDYEERYRSLSPKARNFIESSGIEGLDNYCKKNTVGIMIDGVVNRIGLNAVFGNRTTNESLLKMFPGLKSLEDAVGAIRQRANEMTASPEAK